MFITAQPAPITDLTQLFESNAEQAWRTLLASSHNTWKAPREQVCVPVSDADNQAFDNATKAVLWASELTDYQFASLLAAKTDEWCAFFIGAVTRVFRQGGPLASDADRLLTVYYGC